MKIYSFIPCLFDEIGHHYSYHSALSKAFMINDWKDIKLIPTSCKIKNLPKQWQKQLILYKGSKRKSIWSNVIKPSLNFFPFLKILRDIKKDKGLKKTCFFEYFTLVHLIAFYLAVFFVRPNCSLWILYRTDLNQVILGGKIHKFIHKLLIRAMGQNKLMFFTDSSLLAMQFEKFFEKKFYVLPIPHTSVATKQDIKRKKTDKILCWWPGGSIREEKGLSQIKKISKNKSFQKDFSLIVAKEALQFLGDDNSIKYVKTNLSSNEYNNIMANSHLILLPYSSSLYRLRTSGIFVEAIVAKKNVIVTEDTWMANELNNFDLSEFIVNWDDPNLFDKLKNINISKRVESKLAKMSQFYQTLHTPVGFAKILANVLHEG